MPSHFCVLNTTTFVVLLLFMGITWDKAANLYSREDLEVHWINYLNDGLILQTVAYHFFAEAVIGELMKSSGDHRLLPSRRTLLSLLHISKEAQTRAWETAEEAFQIPHLAVCSTQSSLLTRVYPPGTVFTGGLNICSIHPSRALSSALFLAHLLELRKPKSTRCPRTEEHLWLHWCRRCRSWHV